MKGIVLTAGFGTRLLPLTNIKPKALFPIIDRPIIDVIIGNLKKAGIREIGINLHYFADQICDYLGKGEKHGVRVEYRFEEEILETGGGLANFADFIGNDEHFIVHNCDILTSIDLEEAIKCHVESEKIATLVSIIHPSKSNILVDDRKRILDIGGRFRIEPKNGDSKVYGAGIFIYTRNIFKVMPEEILPYPIVPVLLKHFLKYPESATAYWPEEKTYWRDIGTVDSYLEAHKAILSGEVNFPGIGPFPDMKWIHPNARVAKDVSLLGFVSIGNQASVGAGSTLENCILLENASVSPGSTISSQVIGG